MRFSVLRVAAAATAMLVSASPASAQAVRSTAGFALTSFPGCDDSCSGQPGVARSLGFTARLFGADFTSVFVNNNGAVHFGGASTSYYSRVYDFGLRTIAPFAADIYTGGSNPVTVGTGTIDGRNAFVANWPGVQVCCSGDARNVFQAALIDRSDVAAGDFDFELNYNQVQWSYGGVSIGYADGTGVGGTQFEFAGGDYTDAGAEALVAGSRDSDVDGRYRFSVHNGQVLATARPESTVTPEPGTYALLATGLAGIAAVARRRRA